jgi:hypothetical protein
MRFLERVVVLCSLLLFFTTLAMASDTMVDSMTTDYSFLDQIETKKYMEQYIVLAKAEIDTDPASDGAEGDKALSEECRSFANQPDADLGDVLKAGCEPTLAQMSKLMDNPVGNVAMLFTQYDSYHMENDANGETGIQGVYMGIAQFPKKLNENWSLINRIVWTVPSIPLDQDKIDDFDGGDYGNIPPSLRLHPASRHRLIFSADVPQVSAICTTLACSPPQRGLSSITGPTLYGV